MRLLVGRCCWAMMLALLAVCAWGAPPIKDTALEWHQEEISFPAQPLPAPLPWVKSPVGPGEFLLGSSFRYRDESVLLHRRRYDATVAGLMVADDTGCLQIVPAAFGQPCMVVGEMEGFCWVQQRDGTLLGLNPDTQAVQERVHGLTGSCFAIDATSIWCYDSMEMAHGALRKEVMNRAGFASALIEYDRTGVVKRRFPTDGVTLPKVEIGQTIVDKDVVWITAQPCLGIICSCGAKSYGETHLFRLDRATGKITLMKDAKDINGSVLDQSDTLIWTTPTGDAERQPGKTCPVYLFNKQTLTVTQPAQIPIKYAMGLYAVQDGKLWCISYSQRRLQYLAEGERNPPLFAVFALADGRRLHLDEAGSPPPYPFPQTALTTYRVLGGQPDRVWISVSDGNLCEIPDTGEPRVRNGKALGEITPLVTRGFNMASVLLATVGNHEIRNNTLLAIRPESDRAMRVQLNDLLPFAASDRRAWFFNTNSLVTCGADLKPRAITLPHQDGSRLIGNTTVAVNDKLYFFSGSQAYVADGATGKATPLTSWGRQAPSALAHSDEPGAAFLATDGQIVFNLSSPRPSSNKKPDEHPTATLAAYDPKTGNWIFTPSDRIPYWGDSLNTTHGVFHVATDSDELYRGTATAWIKVGRLPFSMSDFRFGASTAQYLYLDTPLGLYRVRWEELLTDGKEAH